MKCHILFFGKNKKNISKCRLLKILPRVLSVKGEILVKINARIGCCYHLLLFIQFGNMFY